MGRPKGCEPEEIVLRALEVFQAKGYEGTSMEALVKATGVSRFSLYETYGDKHGLFIAVLKVYLSQIRETTTELFARPEPRLDVLRAYYENAVAGTLKRTPLGCLVIHSIVERAHFDEEVATLSSEHFSRMEEIFMGLLEQAEILGEIPPRRNRRATARFLLNTSRGIRTVVRVTRDPKIMCDIIDETIGMLKA